MRWKNKKNIRLTLRLPEDLHEKLVKKVEGYQMKPSFNDYIIKTLLRSLDSSIPF